MTVAQEYKACFLRCQLHNTAQQQQLDLAGLDCHAGKTGRSQRGSSATTVWQKQSSRLTCSALGPEITRPNSASECRHWQGLQGNLSGLLPPGTHPFSVVASARLADGS